MRKACHTSVVRRSSLLVEMLFCLLVASVLVFVLISTGLAH